MGNSTKQFGTIPSVVINVEDDVKECGTFLATVIGNLGIDLSINIWSKPNYIKKSKNTPL
jgi:hypothetical protein